MSDHQHSNNFLKNLSQKKYAWMEEAAAPVSPVASTSGQTASTQSAQPSSSSPDARNKNKATSATASSSSPKKTKKQKPNADSHHDPSSAAAASSTSKSKKGSSPPPSSSSTKREKPGPKPGRKTNTAHSSKTAISASSTIAASAENGSRYVKDEDDQPITTSIDYMKDQPLFKYTTFPVKGYNILPTRNITSNYAKNDSSYFPGHKAGSEELLPNVSVGFEWHSYMG